MALGAWLLLFWAIGISSLCNSSHASDMKVKYHKTHISRIRRSLLISLFVELMILGTNWHLFPVQPFSCLRLRLRCNFAGANLSLEKLSLSFPGQSGSSSLALGAVWLLLLALGSLAPPPGGNWHLAQCNSSPASGFGSGAILPVPTCH